MAVPTTQFSQVYDGNNSTSVAYVVPFPFLAIADIKIAVKPSGGAFARLTDGQFTVTRLPDGSGGGVTTAAAVPASSRVQVFRETPQLQPVDLLASGALPADSVEEGMDRATMTVQEIDGRLRALEGLPAEGVISVPGSSVALAQDVATWADAAARSAVVPKRAGQLGVQLDNDTVWIAQSTAAGDWQQSSLNAPAVRRFASVSAMMAAVPDFVGQIAWPGNKVHPYRSTGTAAGNWTYAPEQRFPWTWHERGWDQDETLVDGERRYLGHLGAFAAIRGLHVTVATPGGGELKLKVWLHTGSGVREVAAGTLTIAAGGHGTEAGPEAGVAIAADLFTAGPGVLAPGDKVEVEIVSTGDAVTITTTGGNNMSTPAGGSLPLLTTGSKMRLATGEVIYALATNGNGTIVMSHPAAATAVNAAATGGGAVFARGVFALSVAAGARTVPAPAITAGLVRLGDEVVGPTVEAGTVIAEINSGTNDLTLSRPLLAATSYIGIVSRGRQRVFHFTAIGGANGDTEIALPVTGTLRVGDSVLGTNIPAGAIIAALDAAKITLSAPITGDITEITVSYPRRTATAAAASTAVTLNAGTVPLGALVEGPGVPPETYLSALSGTTATLSRGVAIALTNAPLTFSRDVAQLTASIAADSAIVTLPYAASGTAIEVGWVAEGPGISTGVKVIAISGAQITLSAAATATSAAALLKFQRTAPWKGLALSLGGHAWAFSD